MLWTARRTSLVLAATFVAGCVGLVTVQTALAQRHRPRPRALRLHPVFRPSGTVGMGARMLANQRYLYLGTTGGISGRGRLIDEKTGWRQAISEPGCLLR